MAQQNEYSVRRLRQDDEAAWRRLWTGYLEYYKTTVSEEVYATTFARLLSGKDGEFCAFVACHGDQPIGLTHYLFHRHCWKIEPVCYLQDLFTDPAHRGRGIGRLLIEAVYHAADAEGAPAVYWLTQEFNYAGRALYDKVAEKTPFIKYARA